VTDRDPASEPTKNQTPPPPPPERAEATERPEPSERTEPIALTEPADPAKPTDQAKPTEPVERLEPAESAERAESIEPVERVEPIESVEPTGSIGPVEHVEPVEPAWPVEPVEAAEVVGDDGGGGEIPVVVSRRYDCSDLEQRAAGLADAAAAVREGRLVVIPTDTVYGIGADAFTPSAVNALLAAKGRGRDMPVPVLVGTVRAANALIEDFGSYGQDLVETFWPGPLTLICRASRSLQWDLGETKGTVALRMPLHAVALDLLKDTGPMAVSSANRSGGPPATTAEDAEEQLGDAVSVYLDGGRCVDNTPSTIIDLTTPVPRVLRKGAIPVEKLRAVVGYLATED
jgi:tRNA threonylcarbamoyl adenosine modification protein (Sua5/YciO/YrdC/YwlC family)